MLRDIGVIGLGKLGLPVSVAIALSGHDVAGYDIDAEKRELYRAGEATAGTGAHEPRLDARLESVQDAGNWTVVDTLDAMPSRDIVFVVVPTPENDDGEGFDTQYLESACRDIDRCVDAPIVSVVSTMLPGTTRRVASIFDDDVEVLHTPAFTAMGRTIKDYRDPEFVIIGEETPHGTLAGDVVAAFYDTVNEVPVIHRMSWESAELTKLSYNGFIGLKIGFANTLMELCHDTENADVDAVTGALQHANRRLTSPAYLTGGMGDGGGCHPKDNRALSSWAAERHVTVNPFEFAVEMREEQTRWLAGLAAATADDTGTPITVLGARYKANTNLTTDSSSLLLAAYLDEWGFDVTVHDPGAGYDASLPDTAQTFVVASRAPFVHEYPYPSGSTVIDVWRELDAPDDVRYVPVGAGSHPE